MRSYPKAFDLLQTVRDKTSRTTTGTTTSAKRKNARQLDKLARRQKEQRQEQEIEEYGPANGEAKKRAEASKLYRQGWKMKGTADNRDRRECILERPVR